MNLKDGWELRVDERVDKELRKFPAQYGRALAEVIVSLAADPYAGDIKKAKGERNSWRRRVGACRIFYDIYSELRLIHVAWVERRTSKTY